MKPSRDKNPPMSGRQVIGMLCFLVAVFLPALEVGGFGFGLTLGVPFCLVLALVGGALGGYFVAEKLSWAGLLAGAVAGPCGFLGLLGYVYFRTSVFKIELFVVSMITAGIPGMLIYFGLATLVQGTSGRRLSAAARTNTATATTPAPSAAPRVVASTDPLLTRLASLRLQVRFLDGWMGICAVIALILTVGVAVGFVDFWLHVPTLFRAGILVSLLVGAGLVAYHYLIYPFARPADDLNLALRIEEIYPELNDSLASTVQFMQQSPEEQARLGGSEALRERTVQDATQKAATCDFGRILDRRSAAIFGGAALCVALLAGFVIAKAPTYSGIAFWRFVDPFGGHTWTTITVERQTPPRQDEEIRWKTVEPRGTDRVAKGRPYYIKVKLEGQMPRKGEAKVEIQGQIRSDKLVQLEIAEDKLSAEFMTFLPMTEQPQTFKFRIVANDGSFPPRANTWHEVEVLAAPKLVEPPQIAVYPPKYTELPSPEIQPPGAGLVKLYAGSNVVLRGKADRPLKEVWIDYQPEKAENRQAAMLAAFGQLDPLQAALQTAAGHAVWGKFPATLEGDNSAFSVTFQPWVTGKFILHLIDDDELATDIATDLSVLQDPVPEVRVISPRTSVTRLPDGELAFRFLVTDEQFAIRSVVVEARRKGIDEGDLDKATRTVIYDANDFGKLLPIVSANIKTPAAGLHPLMGKFPFTPPELHLRHKKLDVGLVWALRNQFKEGDLVVIQIAADDFCDVYPFREPGRGTEIELRIIGKRQMITKVEQSKLGILDQLKKIVEFESKSLDAVKGTRKAAKIDQKIRDDFTDNAEGAQREVEGRVASLRNEVRELRDLLKQNKLTGEKSYQDAGMIQGTLDSIAQQELPLIAPKLGEIRNELAKADKNPPTAQKKLDETAKLQNSVIIAINELIKKLTPEAKMESIRNQIRDIKEKEQAINKATEDLKKDKDAYDKDPNLSQDQKNKAGKEELAKIAQDQQELANQVQNLLKEMKKAEEEFRNDGDKRNADKLKDAIKNIEEPEKEKAKQKEEIKDKQEPIPAQMKNIAKDFKDKNKITEQDLQKQKDIVQNLDKTLQNLEGKNERALNQDIKDRKEAEKKIEDVAKELDKLREEAKKIQMIEDKEERLKQKQELAKKAEKLQEQMDDLRRELARLDEQRAANDLKDAADELDKAMKKLNNDGNPQGDLNQAKKDLNKAKQEIQEAQEELARELLVKIADQLEGLKMRQEAVLQRTETLQPKVLRQKKWSDGLLDTLNGNIDAQKEIADETDGFKDKLKDAKVFYNILERAKKAMDDAGEVMTIRHKEGQDRRENDFDEDALKDEKEWHADTVRHQKYALKRLDNLLGSIKEEIAKMEKDKKEKEIAKNDPNQQKDPDNGGKEPQQRPRPQGDGIPPMAELKALRAEQVDVKERTADFDKRTRDMKLTDSDKKELDELTRDQTQVRELFDLIVQQMVERERQMQEQNPGRNEEKKDEKKGADK